MKTILIYGDSNTWGYVPGEMGSRFAFDERWPGVLRQELGEGYHIINEGLCGRTTTSDDSTEGEERNGAKTIKPIILKHSPLDYVIIMLGTNDLQNVFEKSSMEIALGVATIVKTIRKITNQNYTQALNSVSPEILVIVPPPILEVGPFKYNFIGGSEKSKSFAQAFKLVGEQYNFNVFDTSKIIESSEIDGIHLSKAAHKKLGMAVAKYLIS